VQASIAVRSGAMVSGSAVITADRWMAPGLPPPAITCTASRPVKMPFRWAGVGDQDGADAALAHPLAGGLHGVGRAQHQGGLILDDEGDVAVGHVILLICFSVRDARHILGWKLLDGVDFD
jgi:hypothetical protein